MSNLNGTANKEAMKHAMAMRLDETRERLMASIDAGLPCRVSSRVEPPLPGTAEPGAQVLSFSFGKFLRPQVRDTLERLSSLLEAADGFDVEWQRDPEGRTTGALITFQRGTTMPGA